MIEDSREQVDQENHLEVGSRSGANARAFLSLVVVSEEDIKIDFASQAHACRLTQRFDPVNALPLLVSINPLQLQSSNPFVYLIKIS